MGDRGPVPNRSDKRRRRNKPEGVGVTHAPAGDVVQAPETDESWHPIAKRFFDSLKGSGQAHYYEASDWAKAYLLAHVIDDMLHAQVGKISSMKFQSVMSAMAGLGVDEGDRRRMKVELDRADDEDDAEVIDIKSMQAGMG